MERLPWRMAIVMLVLAVMCNAGCTRNVAPLEKGFAKGANVLLLGSSTIAGNRGPGRIENVMMRQMKEMYPEGDFTVYNMAGGGMWIGPWDGEVPSRVRQPLFQPDGKKGRYDRIRQQYPDVDAVISSLIGHDGRVYSAEVYGRNLAGMCDRLEQDYPGIKIFLQPMLIYPTDYSRRAWGWWHQRWWDIPAPARRDPWDERWKNKVFVCPYSYQVHKLVKERKERGYVLLCRTRSLGEPVPGLEVIKSADDHHPSLLGTKRIADFYVKTLFGMDTRPALTNEQRSYVARFLSDVEYIGKLLAEAREEKGEAEKDKEDFAKGARVLLLGGSALAAHNGKDRLENVMINQMKRLYPQGTFDVQNMARAGMWIGPGGAANAEGASESLFGPAGKDWYSHVQQAGFIPDAIFVQFSGSDSKAYPLEDFAQQLAALCNQLEKDFPNAKIFLSTGMYLDHRLFPQGLRFWHVRWWDRPLVAQHDLWDTHGANLVYVRPYHEVIRAIAGKRGYVLADIDRRMWAEVETDSKGKSRRSGAKEFYEAPPRSALPSPQCTKVIADLYVRTLFGMDDALTLHPSDAGPADEAIDE